MNFSKALENLKKGYLLEREGWNGKGMYLIYVGGSGTDVPASDDPIIVGGDYHINENLVNRAVERLPWIGMKTADNKFVPWLASQTDLLADDWQDCLYGRTL